ncbi:MAG: hypothetical protein IJ261_04750 [Clostridia bacterium]|nr:hypothetical protein [Clostridia bacterium]
MNNKSSCSFEYTYSSSNQEEIRRIRAKYIPHEEDKMELLHRLDKGVTKKGTVAALIIGVISSLILGIGMCCCLVWADRMFIAGIFIGMAGIIGISMAYPVYVRITKKERERIAPEIIRLTDELMK